MKKLYFYVLLLPLWGFGGLFGNFAFGQVSVELMGKTNTVVSFTVSWRAKAPYNNKIWVLAQYSAAGIAEERALVTEVSAIGATASTVTGHRGFWLETSGVNGSATVTATLSLADGVENFNWCVYAFDYPPNAVLQSDGTYQLRGSPPFTVNGDKLADGVKTFGAGTCITAITDATDNPEGIVLATAWYSGGGASQTVTVGDAITPITFVTTCTTCTTSVTSSGLPDGISGTWSSPYYTVSGIPVLTGTYNYTLTVEDGNSCSNTSVIGTIKVEALPGTNQDQGSCTFTQPPVVSTFALFPATYSASTFVTLTDERDRNNYTVVLMPDGKWWMAQNLNYQGTTQGSYTFSLIWNQYSNQVDGSAFTSTTNGIPAIGSFWCPAGTDGATTTASSANRAGCTLYGALYTYEAAMMVDGKWSDETHSNSNFVEPTEQYGTSTTSGNTNNNARGVAKRGICPPNWHVPTDAEWGNMFNKVTLNKTNFNSGTGFLGTNNNAGEAGALLKSKCTCSSGNSGCVDDTQNNWFYPTDLANVGTDAYGFRALPTGYRYHDGSSIWRRGLFTMFWTSSASSSNNAWRRYVYYHNSTVFRDMYPRSYGWSVRCVMN
jgi:uncharacterized protein (TIGR02145 family)